MKTGTSDLPVDVSAAVSALVKVLHDTRQRLEQLTAAAVDTVADHDGRPFELRRTQEPLRHIEADKQTAVLDTLHAHIALLDMQGRIISVNETWRGFGRPNAIQDPGHEMGVNYLDICDDAQGNGASEAHQVAAGVRAAKRSKMG